MNDKPKFKPFGWILAVLLFFLGLVLLLFLRGYSFSAYICFGLSALVVCYKLTALLEAKSVTAAKVLRTLLTLFLCLGLMAAAITCAIVYRGSLGEPDTECDYIIVLGAGVHGTEPSLSLQNRIDAAYEYLTAHPDTICVVSGGQGPDEGISEAYCMYRELTEMGIDPSRVWMEDRSTSTMENLQFSLDIIRDRTGTQPTEVGIVSSEYHLYRAGLMAADLGLTSHGIPAHTTWLSLRVNYFLREIAGVWFYELFGG